LGSRAEPNHRAPSGPVKRFFHVQATRRMLRPIPTRHWLPPPCLTGASCSHVLFCHGLGRGRKSATKAPVVLNFGKRIGDTFRLKCVKASIASLTRRVGPSLTSPNSATSPGRRAETGSAGGLDSRFAQCGPVWSAQPKAPAAALHSSGDVTTPGPHPETATPSGSKYEIDPFLSRTVVRRKNTHENAFLLLITLPTKP
jgi:hypothetical protein